MAFWVEGDGKQVAPELGVSIVFEEGVESFDIFIAEFCFWC